MKYGPRVLGKEEYERQQYMAEGGRSIYGSKVVSKKEEPKSEPAEVLYSDMKVADILPLIFDKDSAEDVVLEELQMETPRTTILNKAVRHLDGELREQVKAILGE